ncbi:hypothetical protein MMC27_002892 [Xylographa pallens]|nr:hypothetical protein [Xylographa pallens]
MQIAIKQYIPLNEQEPDEHAITIIAAHALGFPKEVYEPLWDELLQRSRKNGFSIRGIWIADMYNQGASGVLNEYLQGDDPSWFDHSRDLLVMINKFKEQMPPPLMGVGHSMGATQLVHLSIMHPRLLSSLMLIEPIIQTDVPPGPNAAMMSTFRQDLWPSLPAAHAAFRKNKFFASWEPRVLDKFLEHGFREMPTIDFTYISRVPEGSILLKTSKHQEAWCYTRPNFEPIGPPGDEEYAQRNRLVSPDLDPNKQGRFISHRAEPVITFGNLPFLRPRVLYLFGGQSPLSDPQMQAQKVDATGVGVGGSGGVAEGKVEKVVFEDAGHLPPFERAGQCAEVTAAWLGRQIQHFKREDAFYASYDSGKSARDMVVTTERWRRMVRLPTSTLRPLKGNL